jgi:hypothetical protein
MEILFFVTQSPSTEKYQMKGRKKVEGEEEEGGNFNVVHNNPWMEEEKKKTSKHGKKGMNERAKAI